MKNKKLIIGNWKMNPETKSEASREFKKIKTAAGKIQNVQTVVATPFVYLGLLSKDVSGHRCVLGAQDMFWEESGSFTGEVSAPQLKSLGVSYVLLGHSEMRALGETDQNVAKKLRTAIKYSMNPVVCVGELTRGRGGEHYKYVRDQVIGSLDGIPAAALPRIVIAYEPVWAISSHKDAQVATPEDAEEMIIFIQKVLSEHYKLKRTPKMTFIYGGSSNSTNAEALLAKDVISGLLPGRASLDSQEFIKMLKIANES
ncbi:MAG: triosephosphate isomerase [Candidatus Paceibacteria bacterium]|jgi:triosephosphate isomerase